MLNATSSADSFTALANGIGTLCPCVFEVCWITPELWKQIKYFLFKIVKFFEWKCWVFSAAYNCALLEDVITKVGFTSQPLC